MTLGSHHSTHTLRYSLEEDCTCVEDMTIPFCKIGYICRQTSFGEHGSKFASTGRRCHERNHWVPLFVRSGNANFLKYCRKLVDSSNPSISNLPYKDRGSRCRFILETIAGIVKPLTVVLYLSSGNPSRGSEMRLHLLPSSQVCPRIFMLISHRVAFILGRDKHRAVRGGNRRVFYCLPDVTTRNLYKFLLA